MLVLTLPLPPNAANSRRHWRVVLKEKKAYWAKLNVLTKFGTEPKAPRSPFDPAHISAHLYVHQIMDTDNVFNRLKIALDWMKGLYIVDDAPGHLQWAGIPSQTVDRKNPRVVLTLSPEHSRGRE